MTKRMVKKRKRLLNDIHRTYIVQQVACFMGPTETAAAVNKEFGLNVSRQAIERYNPHKHAGRRLAQRWKELFEIERQAFIDHAEKRIPLAFKTVRIKVLSEAAMAFKANGNFMTMADMLERIAKEVGNVHTNRREVTGKGGGAIKYEDVGNMTDEMLDDEIERLWAKREAARLGNIIEVTPTTTSKPH